MRFSPALTVASATLAAAAPSTQPIKAANVFSVDKFVFGCTVTCDYSFDVTNFARSANHPPVTEPVTCSGSLDAATDYKNCGAISETQTISAYISKDDSVLHLRYTVTDPNAGAVYSYYGDEKVYSATGENASLQKPAFNVPENRATAVA